jgi:hypothetical protein
VGGKKGERARAGAGKKERERERERESAVEQESMRPANTAFTRHLCPCSHVGSAPALALALCPLPSCSHCPCLLTGKGGCPPPLYLRVVFARCQGEDVAPARSCVCDCCSPPLPLLVVTKRLLPGGTPSARPCLLY